MNSSSGCFSGNISLIYLNQPKCTIIKSETDSYSLYIIFNKNIDCSEGKNVTDWGIISAIVIGSVLGLVLIVVVVVLAIPQLRSKVIPFERNKSILIDS